MNVSKRTSITLIALMIFFVSSQHPNAGNSLRNISGFVFLAMIVSALYERFKKQKEGQQLLVTVANAEISSVAPRGKSLKEKIINNVFLAIGGMFALAVFGNLINPGGKDRLMSEAYYICQSSVIKGLKSPTTASFPSFVEAGSDGIAVDIVVPQVEFAVYSYVDAENSFGAKLRTPYTCLVKKVGNGWIVEKLNIREK